MFLMDIKDLVTKEDTSMEKHYINTNKQILLNIGNLASGMLVLTLWVYFLLY